MRIKLNEITLSRIAVAIGNRMKNVIHIFSWNYSKKGISSQQDLRKFKNRHEGGRCFLIANGPSLANMDLRFLKDEITIGMNRINLIYDKLGFIPTYHFVINNLVLEQFSDELNQIQSVKFYNWSKRHLFRDSANQNYLQLKLDLNDQFSVEPSKGIWSGGTVTYAAMQMIYYMGFSEIYIVGLDHNFKEQGRPNKTEVRSQEKDESHFHPDYFPKGFKWQLPDLYRSELAYATARREFEKNGRIILDATVNGNCTIFEKVPFEKIRQHLI
jgi:hypothetical protein